MPENDYELSANDEKKLEGKGGVFSHYKCYKYKKLRKEWEQAIEAGTKRSCPSCGVGGIKDDACTHMTCDNCNTVWCYFCGLAEEDLDKEDENGSIYSHNVNWAENEERCPMYLTEIGQVDDRWETNCDQTAKTFFHKLLTYKSLNEFFNKHSSRKFKKLCKVFPTVKQHGYDLEEAQNMDLTLIKRD